MELTITDRALEKIAEVNKEDRNYLLLAYDADGCGCGVNGLPSIRLKETKDSSFQPVNCEEMDTIVHYQQKTFFAKEMKLDYNGATFRLSSPNEMLNPIISVQSLLEKDFD
ncbi:uncharacterized protein YqkB [Gracilibacillus halotolerans]|uniref:Uncharacterized protein YqkB n=1 Tax=Gracilibacillus halotolerans TaxID=74386 RepID=A0A841RL81_9BACI|nr:iron-sulfur cluster biosynthesis family protein [Gracilibacillus halotolerans]MBB6511724.1 uncharacterized protein YqkB [Gracilibacillus halotolerans]